MRSRFLILHLAIAATLLVHACSDAADTTGKAYDGIVTVCEGTAFVRRGRNLYTVVRGCGIQLGDRIETTQGATVSLAMQKGPAITLTELTSTRVLRHLRGWVLTLDAGQIRAVNDGKLPLQVDCGENSVNVGRAIVHVDRFDSQLQFEVQNGSGNCRSPSNVWNLTAGQSYEIDAHNWPREIDDIAWNCDSRSIRLVAAQQTTPVLEPPIANTAPTAPVGRSNQLGGSQTADNGAPLGTAAPNSQSPLNDSIVTDEVEDDLRFAQQQQTTRGSDQDDNDSPFAGALGTFSGSSSLSLGSLSGSTGALAAGGLFGDANQQTFQGMVVNGSDMYPTGSPFPGAIHLVTAENRLNFTSVKLNDLESAMLFNSNAAKYYSIGTGPKPTGQVLTNFFTGTGAVPVAVEIPRFGDHLIFLDQYNITDPINGGLSSNVGLTGLLGPEPTGPVVVGTAPLEDSRANFNHGATFALGEFLVSKKDANGIEFSIRRSDQDRLIVKDPGGNDALDQVTTNEDVEYELVEDPRFLPQVPLVEVPDADGQNSLNPRGTGYNELSFRRRAAFTTLVADQLKDYARRTGQTRFVVDGKIVDISGYRPAH